MGWDFTIGASRKDIVTSITKDFVGPESGDSYHAIAHKSEGGRVLWVLWELNQDEDNRFIGCYLTKSMVEIDRYTGEKVTSWGHKSMSEGMYPYYFGCPLEYLDMAPVKCPEWREKVIEYHAKRNRKVEVGQKVALVDSTVPWVRIVSTRPLHGVYKFKQYRIPKKMLGEVIE